MMVVERKWAARRKHPSYRGKHHSCTVDFVRMIADASKIQGLENAIETACKELGDEFADNIYDKYGKQVNCKFVEIAD